MEITTKMKKTLEKICVWEEVQKEFRLPSERCGDLIIANRPGYGWNEKITVGQEIFSRPLKTGYKQSIISENTPAMWTPFVVMGPNVRKDNFLGDEPIEMIDQYPTIMRLLGMDIPDFVQGNPVRQVFEDPGENE